MPLPNRPKVRHALFRVLALVLAVCPLCAASALADETEMRLWPATPPGKIAAEGEERDTTGDKGREVEGRRVIRLGHVSTPMLTLYSPPEDKNTGAAVLVCPGGGYSILAYDLEGTEVCEWLNSIGVTGILLKYRVPRPKGNERPSVPEGPLMDAQRAMSLIRANADDWKINPEKIGVLGFSAGGNLAARLATNFSERNYEAVDDADNQPCRPDFAVLVYPAYLYTDKDDVIADTVPVDKGTPPMFLTMAFDDPVGPENILRLGISLKRNEIPCEVHLYPTGGHGYGLRRNEHEATSWPDRCGEWMAANGWLEK